MFQCSTCTTVFSHKHHLQRHLTRKKKCEVNTGIIKENIIRTGELKFECKICNTFFSHKHHLQRHLTRKKKCGVNVQYNRNVEILKHRKRKYTIVSCQNVANEKGGKCLSTEYKNTDAKMEWECKKGHVWRTSFTKIKRGGWCPKCCYSKSENLCRQIIEELTNKKFPSIRPDFLRHEKTGRNLELDGYNEELKLAFEYNGKQHYEYIPSYFHREGEHKFIKQQERDKLKIEICNKLGIKVIVIPYQYDYTDEDKLRSYIKSLL